ncbi:MAG: hypothetical protein SV253_05880 [Halobacteria archaeon]|nr:hypothetical protein [Halobacteria archaeon]
MSLTVPKRKDDFRLMARTARLVLSVPAYAVLAVVAGFVGLNVLVISQNMALFLDTVVTGSLPLGARLGILQGLYPFVSPSYPFVMSAFILAVAGLFGVNLSMLAYHFKENGVSVREGSGSVVGLVLGVLGAGCAACGTAVLAGILSVFGVVGGLAFLPFDGVEFSVLAAVALLVSVYWIADGMRGGEVAGCPVDV